MQFFHAFQKDFILELRNSCDDSCKNTTDSPESDFLKFGLSNMGSMCRREGRRGVLTDTLMLSVVSILTDSAKL